MMDREWRDEWVRALRSGEFKQGRGNLKDRGYCCLGVLCEIRPDVVWQDNFANHDQAEAGRLLSKAFLPDSLRSELKIDAQTESTLAALNDAGNSFAVIADYIEAHL